MRRTLIPTSFLTVLFALTALYGLYALVICQNHTLAHSLVGAACPKTDLLKYFSVWKQTFIWTISDSLIMMIVMSAVAALTAFLKPQEYFSNPRKISLAYRSLLPVTTHAFFRFIGEGKLHPEIYAR